MMRTMIERHISCVLFDLDGTLVYDYLLLGPDGLEPDPEHPYTEPHLMPNRIETLRAISLNVPFVSFGICTNQAGAALGHCTEAETQERLVKAIHLTDHMGGLGRPFTIQACMHHPDATVEPWASERTRPNLQRRKPNGGMLIDAMTLLRKDPRETMFVGDRQSDKDAAVDAGVDGFMWAEDFFA